MTAIFRRRGRRRRPADTVCLRNHYTAIYPGVHIARNSPVTAALQAEAARLWSRRRGIVAGLPAAVLHGAKWVEGGRPAELIHHNRHPPRGYGPGATPSRTTKRRPSAASRSRLRHGRRWTSGAVAPAAAKRSPDGTPRCGPLGWTAARLRSCSPATAAVVVSGTRRALAPADGGAESPRENGCDCYRSRPDYAPQTPGSGARRLRQIVARLGYGLGPSWQHGVEYDGDHH